MEFKKSFVDREEIEAPDILYKYRDWQLAHHRTIITKQHAYFAAPCDFEDPLDCKLIKRFDLMNDQEIYDRYRKDSNTKHPHFSLEEHMDFAIWSTQNAPFKDSKYLKEVEESQWIKYNDRMGVFSLTANPTNPTMWEKYSDYGKGICVGFDTKILFKWAIGGGPVTYYDELPTIYPNDPHEIEHWKQVYSKERKWEFEQEYRLYKFHRNPVTRSQRVAVVPKQAFKRIVFGSQTSELHIDQVFKVCQELGLNVMFQRYDSKLETLNDFAY